MQQSLADISAAAKQMNGTVVDILAELGDAPDHRFRGDRLRVRDRLETLETESRALKATKKIRAEAWSSREKLGLFGFSAIAAVGVVLRLFGVG